MKGETERGLGIGLATVGEGSLDTSYGDLYNRAHAITHTPSLSLNMSVSYCQPLFFCVNSKTPKNIGQE